MLATRILASFLSFPLTLFVCAHPFVSSRALSVADPQEADSHAVKIWSEHRMELGNRFQKPSRQTNSDRLILGMLDILKLAVSSRSESKVFKHPTRAGEDRTEQPHYIRHGQKIEGQRRSRCMYVETNADGLTARSVEATSSSFAPSSRSLDDQDAKARSSVASVASETGNDAQRNIETGFRAFDVISCIGTIISTIIAALTWLELRKERKRPELHDLTRRINALEAKQDSLGAVLRAERHVLMREKRAIQRRVSSMEAKGRAFESRVHQMSNRCEGESICT